MSTVDCSFMPAYHEQKPTVFSEGMNAYRAGTAADRCPYEINSKACDEWLRGWQYEMREQQDANRKIALERRQRVQKTARTVLPFIIGFIIGCIL